MERRQCAIYKVSKHQVPQTNADSAVLRMIAELDRCPPGKVGNIQDVVAIPDIYAADLVHGPNCCIM